MSDFENGRTDSRVIKELEALVRDLKNRVEVLEERVGTTREPPEDTSWFKTVPLKDAHKEVQ